MSRAGGGINAGVISSVRSGNGGGGSSGRVFGAAGPLGTKDDVKKGLDQIFGKLSIGDGGMSRNQGLSKLMGAAPVTNIDSNDDNANLERIFGKLSISDSSSRNQGLSKLMGAALVQQPGDEVEDKKKVAGQLSELVPFKGQQQLMGAAASSVNIPIEERKKLLDYVAEIVGGNAVSNIQVQVPQLVGPQQPGLVAQPGPQQPGQPGNVAQPGPQQQNQIQLDAYNKALLQLNKLQQEQNMIQERINLLRPTVVEHFSVNDNKLYTLIAILIIVILVIYWKMN